MGVMFFRKNRIDLDRSNVSITVSDSVATNTGSAFVSSLRNRRNTDGWMTTGSSDSGNTTLMIDMVDTVEIDRILLIKHNLRAYTIKYWNGSAYIDFSTAISETAFNKSSSCYAFTKVTTSKIQIVITGTQIADSDKSICQIILTEFLGEFSFQPRIVPQVIKNRKATSYLSGRNKVVKSVGGMAYSMDFNHIVGNTDLTLIETLFDSFEGFLVWVCGGDDSQYPTKRVGYRLEDIFLMDCAKDLRPGWEDGHYAHGMPLSLDLVEVN
jgi:hypothetical protein